MRIHGTLCQLIACLQHLNPGAVGNQIRLALSGLVVGDHHLALLLGVPKFRLAAELGNDRKSLGLSGLEQLLYTGKTLCDIVACHTAGMESTHGQLCSGLTDGLGGNDAYRFTHLNGFAGGHVGAVALSTDSHMRTAGENGTDFDGLDGLALPVHARAQNPGRTAGSNHMIVLYNQLPVLIVNILTGIPSRDSVFQALNGLLAVHESFHCHAGDLSPALAAVHLPDTQLLGYVYHSSGQVSGVSRTKRRVGQTLAGAVGRHEILQHVQTLTEVGLDGQLNGTACGIRHQTAHTGQLLDLLVGTTGAGVSHHEDIVVFIQTCQKHVRQFLIGLVPGLHHRAVALFLSDESSAEIGGNLIHSGLSLGQQFRLLSRHRHVGNGYRHGSPGGILIADGFHIVQNLRGPGSAVGIDDLFQNLLQALFVHMEIHFQLQEVLRQTSVHKTQILGQDFVKNETSQRRLHIAGHHLALRISLGHPNDDSGMQRTIFVLISQNGFVHTLKDFPLSQGTRPLLSQIIDPQYHILGGHCHRAAVRGLQQVVGRQQQETALCLRLHGKRKMHCHLVAVKVRVESGTHKGVQLDSLTLYQNGLKCLNAQPVQRRSAVEHHGMLFDDLLQHVPNLIVHLVHQFLGVFDVLADALCHQLFHHERLEQLDSHFLGQTALVNL